MTQQTNFPTTPDTAVCARCGEQKSDHIDDELFCMPVTAQTFSDDPFEPMPDDAIAMLVETILAPCTWTESPLSGERKTITKPNPENDRGKEEDS